MLTCHIKKGMEYYKEIRKNYLNKLDSGFHRYDDSLLYQVLQGLH
jgi:hypothetical protein